jgi:glutamate N-acetyltransferase/amino-acid N-acetyltransferase
MSITSPRGFRSGSVSAGLKKSGDLDLTVIINDGPKFDAAGVFTSNQVKAAPVIWTQECLKNNQIKAVLMNSGGANACTGTLGFQNTHQTAEHLADLIGVGAIDIAVCSTGLIGVQLPIEKMLTGISSAITNLSLDGGVDSAKAIMTTDSVPKIVELNGTGYVLGGIAKGAGMLAPSLATMLCVITTDADLTGFDLGNMLKVASEMSFNRIDADGCTSTNDTVLILASGASSVKPDIDEFTSVLNRVCLDLAQQLINDAEGKTLIIEIEVIGAQTEADALRIAKCVAGDSLVKTAMHGRDPNWGRVAAAVGAAGVPIEPNNFDISFNDVKVCVAGSANTTTHEVSLAGQRVQVLIDLHMGEHAATVYTTDLSVAYVLANSEYST